MRACTRVSPVIPVVDQSAFFLLWSVDRYELAGHKGAKWSNYIQSLARKVLLAHELQCSRSVKKIKKCFYKLQKIMEIIL
jgi:hypothetical protein